MGKALFQQTEASGNEARNMAGEIPEGWDAASEFHFKNNSDKVRKAFLGAVAPYEFFYYGIAWLRVVSAL